MFATAAAAQQTTDEMRFLFTGDIMMSRQVKAEMHQRMDSPWADFAELFHSADLVGGNFETAIGDEEACPPENKLCFASPKSSTQLLSAAGFHLVTVENNHSGDLGEKGRDDTRVAFQNSGVLALDFADSPQFLRIGRVTLAMVAITMVKPADGQPQEVPSVNVAQKLRLARQLANVVVVSIHWGNELQDWPSDMQEQQARWLVEHGADIVVGHHPHVVQSPQCVEGKVVFFSLGNHVFDQKYAETKDGLIADCRIHNGQLSCGALHTHTGRGTSYPTLVGRDSASDQALQGCTPQLGPGMQIGSTTIRPEPWSADQPAGALCWKVIRTVGCVGAPRGGSSYRCRRQIDWELSPCFCRWRDILHRSTTRSDSAHTSTPSAVMV